MTVSAGHLDELLNQSFDISDRVMLNYVSGTTSNGLVASLNASTVPGYPVKSDGATSYKITAVNDTLNTILQTTYYNNLPLASVTYYVLGYSQNGILVSYEPNSLIAQFINYTAFPDAVLFALTTNPAAYSSGTTMSYSASYGGGALASTGTTVTAGTTVVPLLRNQAVVSVTNGTGTVTGPGISDALASADRVHFIDGTLAYGANTPEAQAARLYQAAFARAPDASGLAYWAGVLQGGTSLADIAAGFLAGAEFQARYGTLDNTGFVNALYQNVLGRAADASGSAFWTGALASGTSRAQALASFSESAENKTDTAPLLAKGLWAADPNAASAARLFYATLGRAPDAAGLSYWTTQLESGGTTLLKEADLFVTSAEFTSHYGNLDNAGFVNLLYHNVLGRAADAAGLAAWTTQLAQGTSRTSIVLSFSESSELKARLFPVIEQNGIVVT